MFYLDWIALTFTTVGTIVWANNNCHSRYATVYWFIASIAWIGYAYTTGQPALTIRDSTNILLYIYAFYRYVLDHKNVNQH